MGAFRAKGMAGMSALGAYKLQWLWGELLRKERGRAWQVWFSRALWVMERNLNCLLEAM